MEGPTVLILILTLAIASLLAWANGANDVSKGIATLVGSGVTDYRRAIWWGTLWTGFGAALAVGFAGAMLTTFGAGLLAPGVVPAFAPSAAALVGASVWVLLATRASLPVSTTHALVGAVVGAAVVAYGVHGVAWSALVTRIALPLALSPVVAVGLSYLFSRLQAGPPGSPRLAADCLCLTAESAATFSPRQTGATMLLASPAIRLSVVEGQAKDCHEAQPAAVQLTANHLHWVSSGAVSLARGLNDAPKIVALGMAAAVLGSTPVAGGSFLFFAVVGAAMVVGSLVAGRRVTRVLAHDVTPMDHREGLSANLVTASLVATGAVLGWPMSTTHVSLGGIAGVGIGRGALNWATTRTIALAWVVTLPASAGLGAVACLAARALG